jgi:hypothetical protein
MKTSPGRTLGTKRELGIVRGHSPAICLAVIFQVFTASVHDARQYISLVGKGKFRVESKCLTAKRTFPASDQGQDFINYIFNKD